MSAPNRSTALIRLRPIELVELAERSYQRMFSNGLWLMLVGSLTSAAMIVYRGFGPDDVAPAIALGLILIVTMITMRAPERAFRAIRRNQLWVPAVGVGLGILLAASGKDSVALFFSCTTALGILRTACSSSLMLIAAGLAAAGQMWSLLLGDATGGEAQNLAANAAGLFVVPVAAGLLFDYLSRFMLGLQRTIDLASGTSDPHRFSWRKTDAAGEARPASPDKPDPDLAQLAATAQSHRRIWVLSRRSSPERLTVRQLEVIALASEGLKLGEIAACLEISPRQVRRLLEGARRRTGTANTAELVAWAAQNRVFGSPEERRKPTQVAEKAGLVA